MASVASWYHCSVKPVSRSAGRSVVAATFTVVPAGAPAWAYQPEALWNAAERAETRKNSTLAREVELALPSLLSPKERQQIAEAFAAELVDRYRVAVSVAIHEPSGKGDDRNFHAHILFTTREVTADGFGKKTRILDDRKTGPQEVTKLRELAADLINKSLADANSDIRVDHRSFKERGIEQEPTTHLGPAASEMERRGEPSDRGDTNREAQAINALFEEHSNVTAAIDEERERQANPPLTREDVLERMQEELQPLVEAVQTRGAIADRPTYDGMKWWQRSLLRIRDRAQDVARTLAQKLGFYRQDRDTRDSQARERNEGGLER